MIQNQKNKLTTYETVEAYLTGHLSDYSEVEELVSSKDQLISKIGEISDKEDERQNSTKGKTISKNVTRKSVTTLAVGVAGALYAFGKKSGNIELTEKANVNVSKLNRLRNVQLGITLSSLKELAESNTDSLAPFGVSAAKLAKFIEKIEGFTGALRSKQSSGAIKTGAGKTLGKLFKEADDIIDSIDKLLEGFRESNVQFYSGYKAARVIKNLGVRHRPEVAPEALKPPILAVADEPEKK